MTQFLFILAFLLLAATGTLAAIDYVNYTPKPDSSFAFSTVAELWLAVDRDGYMEYRNQYIGKPELWESEALPYLNLHVVPMLIGPAIGVLILAVCVWLLSSGRRERVYTPTHKSGFARNRASESQQKIRYRRK